MKKLSAFLFCLVCTSLVYGQAVELSTIIPANPSVVVDELRVLGSGNSKIDRMNIGMPIAEGAVEPFQTQTLKRVASATPFYIKGIVDVGRDFISNDRYSAPQVNIGENGNFFTNGSTFSMVEAGTFRAKTISGPNSAVVMAVNTALSGKDIDVDAAKIASPFDRGRKISKLHVNTKLLATEDTETPSKRHLFYPWEELSPTTLTGTCGTKYSACNNTSTKFCYEVRRRNLPAVYDAAGATYEKIGTAKFYCKPFDTYDSNGALTSECRHYMDYSARNGALIEGFTSGADAVADPFIGMENSQGFNGATPAEKCNLLKGVSGATIYDEALYFVDVNSQTPVRFSDVFAETCSSADASNWPAGSGLNCQAREKVIDIYALKCYPGSGKLLRASGDYWQRRKVICRQYSNVYNNEKNSVNDIKDRSFFYPVFDINISNSYVDLSDITVPAGMVDR